MIDATVIIAAWNAQETIWRSIESVLSQTGIEFELIIVDDASPDGTVEVAESFAASDSRLKIISLTKNRGPAAARNAGLAAAKGRWVAVLDADDAFSPQRLSDMIDLGEKNGADAVYDDFQPVDSTGRPTGKSHLAQFTIERPQCWDLETYLAGCQAEPGKPSLGYLKPILRRRFLIENQIKYDESLRNGEDFHLIAELLITNGALWVLPQSGYFYTTREGSVSNRLDLDHAISLSVADEKFVAKYRNTMSPEAVSLMLRRTRRIKDLATAETVLRSLRNGSPVKAARALTRRPSSSIRLANQVFEAIQKRLS